MKAAEEARQRALVLESVSLYEHLGPLLNSVSTENGLSVGNGLSVVLEILTFARRNQNGTHPLSEGGIQC